MSREKKETIVEETVTCDRCKEKYTENTYFPGAEHQSDEYKAMLMITDDVPAPAAQIQVLDTEGRAIKSYDLCSTEFGDFYNHFIVKQDKITYIDPTTAVCGDCGYHAPNENSGYTNMCTALSCKKLPTSRGCYHYVPKSEFRSYIEKSSKIHKKAYEEWQRQKAEKALAKAAVEKAEKDRLAKLEAEKQAAAVKREEMAKLDLRCFTCATYGIAECPRILEHTRNEHDIRSKACSCYTKATVEQIQARVELYGVEKLGV